jgi:hypothetical protein
MTSVLDHDPMRRPAAAIRAISTLRHQALQPIAGRTEQVRADLTLLEGSEENAVRSAGPGVSGTVVALVGKDIPCVYLIL